MNSLLTREERNYLIDETNTKIRHLRRYQLHGIPAKICIEELNFLISILNKTRGE